MKTFKDFLQEDITSDIQKKCSLFLKRSEGVPMYRGYGGPISSIFASAREIPIRKDRKPRDSTQYVHALMDAYFQKKFGVKIRSEGLFATGDWKIAQNYGKVHYVFPVGNFKFVWGTHKGDPVSDTLWWTRKIQNMMQTRYEKEGEGVTESVMNEIDWNTDNLPAALHSGAEIAVLADSAIIVPMNQKQSYSELIKA